MEVSIEERYGNMTLMNIFTSVWLGDWDLYDELFINMPDEIKNQFPFQSHYDREQVALWHENYFAIPGDFFVPPYYTAYQENQENMEEWKHSLLGLIGMYEKFGFYYPLEKEKYPDHIGCMTAFISSSIDAQIKAYHSRDFESITLLDKVQEEMLINYIEPTLLPLLNVAENKIEHPFFKEFLRFYKGNLIADTALQ